MNLKRAVWSVLKFEFVWKLLTLVIISPLFDQIYQTYVSSVGVSFNANVLGTFLNLKGGLIFLALFFAAGLLAFYELSVVIRLVALSRQGEVFTIRQVMKHALWSLGAMGGWSVLPGSLYYLLLLPLVQVVYFHSLVPSLTIPWFILGEMQNSAIGIVGMIAIYVACYGLYLLLFFVPILMSLRGERFGQAVKSGLGCFRRLGLRRWAVLLAGLAAWVLGDSELARYWRRNTLANTDFDRYFLKYLVYSEAFRIDLCYWQSPCSRPWPWPSACTLSSPGFWPRRTCASPWRPPGGRTAGLFWPSAPSGGPAGKPPGDGCGPKSGGRRRPERYAFCWWATWPSTAISRPCSRPPSSWATGEAFMVWRTPCPQWRQQRILARTTPRWTSSSPPTGCPWRFTTPTCGGWPGSWSTCPT